MRIWPVVEEMVGAHGRCALVTVAAVRGSAPREPGARMVIAPDGGFHGTIGGGELEWRAIGAARDTLSRNVPAAALDRFTLGPDLGQCCGGSVRLLTEVFERDRLDEVRALAAREAAGPFVTRGRIGPRAVERIVIDNAGHEVPSVAIEDGAVIERFRDLRRPLWLFGAGHVGRALMLALAPLPFDVTWIDEREDVFPAVVPASVRPLRSADPAGELAHAPDGAFVVVMTHNHPLDLAIVHAALAAPSPRATRLPDATTPPGAAAPFGTAAPPDAAAPPGAAGRFGYVGLIGSASKRARFARRLREAGVAEDRIAGLVCPIGMTTIRSKHPAAIAAGIAAQLLERADG